jgi:hypothetical protein
LRHSESGGQKKTQEKQNNEEKSKYVRKGQKKETPIKDKNQKMKNYIQSVY